MEARLSDGLRVEPEKGRAVPSPLAVEPGARRRFAVAGLSLSFHSVLDDSYRLVISGAFRPFEAAGPLPGIAVEVGSRRCLTPARGSASFDSGLNWRLLKSSGCLFEIYHPPSGLLICQAETDERFQTSRVVFDENTCRWLSRSEADVIREATPLIFPYPLEQLLFVAPFAHREGFLMHAAAAVVGERAIVFAGHSGEGKTTLSRMLTDEGVEILSDERIAIRKVDGALKAFGTPWPGEGNLASPAGYPLAGILLLRKSERHGLRSGRTPALTAEILSRCLTPYYLPEAAALVLSLLEEVVASVPVGEVDFAPAPGLLRALARLTESASSVRLDEAGRLHPSVLRSALLDNPRAGA